MPTPRSEREFERIVRSTEGVIRAYVAAMGVAVDEVDDVAQEVYIALYRSLDACPAGVELIRWLKGIAKRQALNHFRRTQRRAQRQREAIAELLLQARGPWKEEGGAPEEALEACLERLPSAMRELIALRYEEGQRAQEIGATLNKSPAAVRVNLHRIRARLKTCIARSLAEGA